jgi:putative heme-binding domain-containing protein
VPKLDLETVEGQLAALTSPAVNVRFLGFERLSARGSGNEEAVAKWVQGQKNAVLRARGVWLLAQISHGGRVRVREMLKDRDAQTRLLALRALRRAGEDPMKHAVALASDESPAVRREVALSMRDVPLEQSRDILLTIAQRYDGNDRWYLEALGIGCEGKEEAMYAALMAKLGDKDPLKWSDTFANIAWRLHPPSAVPALAGRANSPSLTAAQRFQSLDALAFVKSPEAAHAMAQLAQSGPEDVRPRAAWWLQFRRTNDWSDSGIGGVASAADRPDKPLFSSGVITAGSVRIDVDISGATRLWLVVTPGNKGLSCDWADWAQPRLVGPKGELKLTELKWASAQAGFGDVNVDRNCKGRLMRIADKPVPWGIGTHAASEIVYDLPDGYTRLVGEAGLDNGGADGGTDYPGGTPDVEFLVYADVDPARAAALAARDTLLNASAPAAQRRKAAERLATTKEGGMVLLGLAGEGKLPEDVKQTVAEQIFRNPDPSVRALASEHFTRVTTSGEPLPPPEKLLALAGDAARGRAIFVGQGAACSRCHTFRGEGSDVGPDLTEIRTKYDRAGLLDQVLNPSASIALGYEPWLVRTKKGETYAGFVLAESAAALTLKDTSGKKVMIPTGQIDRRVKQKLSVMPDNVALGLKPQEIADLLAFLRSEPAPK